MISSHSQPPLRNRPFRSGQSNSLAFRCLLASSGARNATYPHASAPRRRPWLSPAGGRRANCSRARSAAATRSTTASTRSISTELQNRSSEFRGASSQTAPESPASGKLPAVPQNEVFGTRPKGAKTLRKGGVKSPKESAGVELVARARPGRRGSTIPSARGRRVAAYRPALVGQCSRSTANRNAVDRPNSIMPFSASMAPINCRAPSPGTGWRGRSSSSR